MFSGTVRRILYDRISKAGIRMISANGKRTKSETLINF